MKSDLEALAIPRHVGSPGYYQARDVLVRLMKNAALQPYGGGGFLKPYQVTDSPDMANIVGILPGNAPSLDPILLAAHYDSVMDTPGADDNAAAMVVILSVIRRLAERRPARSVIVAFFDGEEPPHFLTPSMGSIRFHKDQLRQRLHCSLIFDLVGHDVPLDGIRDLLFITGMETNPGLADVMQNTTVDSRIRIVPTLNRYVGDMSDQFIFRASGDPYMFFSCGRWEHYHMPSDTPDKLNLEKMDAIGVTIASMVRQVDKTDLPSAADEYDTTPVELKFLNSALSTILPRVGMTELRSRTDIDVVVKLLMHNIGL